VEVIAAELPELIAKAGAQVRNIESTVAKQLTAFKAELERMARSAVTLKSVVKKALPADGARQNGVE